MSEPKMTRAEFVRNLEREGITAPERVAEHAVAAGVEWLPEPLRYVEGDVLRTEAEYANAPAGVVVERNGGRWYKTINERTGLNCWRDSDGGLWACEGLARSADDEAGRTVILAAAGVEPVTEQTVRDVCEDVDTLVKAGFEAGRRDALREAADAIESEQRIARERLDALRKKRAERRITMGIAQGLLMSLNRIRSLIEEGKNDD